MSHPDPRPRTGDHPAADKQPPADAPSGEDLPSAGPHAEPDLTDRLKTPGAGTMPDVGEAGEDVEPGTG